MESKKDKYLFYAVTLYFFVVVFGNLFRLGDEETGYGISTVLLFVIILSKIRFIPVTIVHNSLYMTIVLLFLWCLLSALFSATSVYAAYFKLGMLFLYMCASIAVYQLKLDENRIKVLFYSLAISIFVASALTIIDFVHIYNVPYVNESEISTKISGERVEQAGGFFPRRSAMAALYSIIIPTLLYYAFKIGDKREIIFMYGISAVSYVALLLTHNRSGVLGIIISLLVYMLIDRSLHLQRKLRIIITMLSLFIFLIFFMYLYLPVHFDVYVMKMASYLPGFDGSSVETEARYIQSDYSRIYFFVSVLESLTHNPIGNGFSKIYTELYGISSPHNIFTYVIWAAGIMSFVWIPLFVLQVRKYFGLKQLLNSGRINHPLVIPVTALQVGLLSWFLNNMAHNSLNTGLAWMYLGLILNIMFMINRSVEPTPTAPDDVQYSDDAAGERTGDRSRLGILKPANKHPILKKRQEANR